MDDIVIAGLGTAIHDGRGGDTNKIAWPEKIHAEVTGLFRWQDHLLLLPAPPAASAVRRLPFLPAEKAQRCLCAIDEAGVETTAEKINAIASQALALAIDVTKRAAVDDMVQLAYSDGFGSVQFLFNSAGAAIRRAKFLEIDCVFWTRPSDPNVKGTFYAQPQARRRTCSPTSSP